MHEIRARSTWFLGRQGGKQSLVGEVIGVDVEELAPSLQDKAKPVVIRTQQGRASPSPFASSCRHRHGASSQFKNKAQWDAPHLEGDLRLQRVWVRHLRHVGPGALLPGEHAQGLQVQGLTRPVKHQPVHVWGGEPMQQPCRLAQATHQLGLIVMRGKRSPAYDANKHAW